MEDKIQNTIPTGAYDMVAQQIKNHVQSRCRRDNTQSINVLQRLELKIKNTKLTISNLKSIIDTNRQTVDKLNEENNEIHSNSEYIHIINLINQINTSNNKNKYLKQFANIDKSVYDRFNNNKIQIEALNKEIEESIEELPLHEFTLKSDENMLPYIRYENLLTKSHESRLEEIEKIYKKNNDLDELRKLVHYWCQLFDTALYGKHYVAPYKNHPIEWETLSEGFKNNMIRKYMYFYNNKEKAFEEIDKTIRKMNSNGSFDWLNDDW